MKIYNAIGFGILGLSVAAAALLAPETMGPWGGAGLGILYFVCVWFLAGIYLSDVIHMGITHGG
jgi:hypothetical protein